MLSKYDEFIIFSCVEYFLAAGVLYMFFYVWKKKKYWHAKIQRRYAENKNTIRDITYSFSTTVIFGIVIILVIWSIKHGHTLVYNPIDKYGYTWYFLSILLIIIIHDTYFYWTHRFLHWKLIFKWSHKTHHLAHNPTPFSAYAFHPVEALINAPGIPLAAFIIPVHISAIFIATFYQLLINVGAHNGYEFFPKGFTTHKIFKWHNTAPHHNMHHKFAKCNYGLYFNFWDRVMKTNHAKYEEYFEGVIAQREHSKIADEAQVEEVSAEV